MTDENQTTTGTKGAATVKVTTAPERKTYPNLPSALAAFQANIPVPTKGAENPHFKSQFASLDSITPIITSKLSQVGIAWSAGAGYQEGQYGVIGKLIHDANGETIEGFFPVIATKPQDLGSAFTYARRYLLLALTGVAPTGEDDDGEKAQESANRAEQAVVEARTQAAAEDALIPLKKRVNELLGVAKPNEPTPEEIAVIKEKGQAFFGRDGWANSEIALQKWIDHLTTAKEAGADPQTGEVTS